MAIANADVAYGMAVGSNIPLNVINYGAKGDGVTDDTVAIRGALAALSAGQTLYFPNGTYNCATWTTAKALTVPVSLFGDGIGKTILVGAGYDCIATSESLTCSGITFDTWGICFDFSTLTTVVTSILIEDCEVKNFTRAIYANNLTADIGVRDLTIRGCRLYTGSSYGIYFNTAIMEQIWVTDCIIKDCVERGIDFGGNSLVYADDRGEYTITGNLIDGVTCDEAGSSSKAAIALIVYGWRATISGNTVKNVSRTSLTGTNCNGIYTKCRYSTITDNLLIDAGQAEGFINVKGGARNETVVQPYGFSVQVLNNTLLDTQTNPVLGVGSAKRSNGIKIATSDVKCSGNYIEGMTEFAIYTDGDLADNPSPPPTYIITDGPCHNISITDNIIKDCRGTAGIVIYGAGNHITVNNNNIDGILNTYDTTTPGQNFGIQVLKNSGDNIDVCNNRIFNVSDTGHSPVGIQFLPGRTYATAYVLNNARVMDNHVESGYYGIQFHGAASDSMGKTLVRHNTFGTAIGVASQVKYSVTPTPLVDLPADYPAISYATTANLVSQQKHGTDPQTINIYNTYTDDNNFQRLSIQAASSKVRLSSEASAAGALAAAQQLEIGVSTTANATGGWKFTGSGGFSPLATGYTMAASAIPILNAFIRNITIAATAPTATASAGNSWTVTANAFAGRINVGASGTAIHVPNTSVTGTASNWLINAWCGADTGAYVKAVICTATGAFDIIMVSGTATTPVNFIVQNTYVV